MIAIRPARFPDDLALVRQLFREYAESLEIDLAFQGFEAELAALPGKYAPPRGRVLLAFRGEEALGCVALRPVDDATCEMKRLFVRPAARGEQLGRRLAERICEEGRAAGYTRICLVTRSRHYYAFQSIISDHMKRTVVTIRPGRKECQFINSPPVIRGRSI